jgi:hypothetical protein
MTGDGGFKKKLMKQSKDIEARGAESEGQHASSNGDCYEEGANRFKKASPEMIAFIECNWNFGDIIKQIFNRHCEQNENVEGVAATDIIEQLANRKVCSGWQIACIAGSIATESYNRGQDKK